MRTRTAKATARMVALGTIVVTSTALGVSVSHAASGKATIAASPSENGYVMVGLRASMTASGFEGSARVYKWHAALKRWTMMGTWQSGIPKGYTFQEPGSTRLRVVPKNGKPRIVTLPVFDRFGWGQSHKPWAYGNLVLSSWFQGQAQVSAKAGCVLVDIGGLAPSKSYTLRVLSSDAPEFQYSVPVGGGGVVGVPIRGDVVVQSLPETLEQKGAVFTCLGDPRP